MTDVDVLSSLQLRQSRARTPSAPERTTRNKPRCRYRPECPLTSAGQTWGDGDLAADEVRGHKEASHWSLPTAESREIVTSGLSAAALICFLVEADWLMKINSWRLHLVKA